MIAEEHDCGLFWTVLTFVGWHIVFMKQIGYGYTYSTSEH